MKVKRLFCLVFFGLLHIHGNAQDIEVKKFEPMVKDQTAALNPRKDINGTVCGLVKVQLKEPGAEFEGNVMGDVQFTGNEYLVYLPNGTKRLGIKHPDYLPTTIVFADYGTKRIASSTTYELKVKTNKKQAKVDNSKKGMAVFNIKPSNAMLLIDGQIADGSGGAYTLSLPYGTHYYTVKLKDFSITNQQVKIDKNAKNVNVDLTEFFTNISINCQDNNAEIIVNNESKSTGNWNGLLVPGKCVVEIRKTGYHPLSKTIELKENDSVSLEFPSLKMISGILEVNVNPKGSTVLINGKKVGIVPLRNEIPIGEYKVSVVEDMYLPLETVVKITDGGKFLVEGDLEATEYKRLFLAAEKNDAYAQKCLADFYFEGSSSLFKNEGYWEYDAAYNKVNYQKAIEQKFSINKDVKQGIYWLKRAASSFINDKEGDSERFYILRRLLHIYVVGEIVERDFAESYKAAKDASECLCNINCGYINEAYWWLAWHYFYGRGTERSSNKALFWLNKLYNGKLNSVDRNTLYNCADQLYYQICTNSDSGSFELISTYMKENQLY